MPPEYRFHTTKPADNKTTQTSNEVIFASSQQLGEVLRSVSVSCACISNTIHPNLTKFSVHVTVAVAQSIFEGDALCYVFLVISMTLSQNGENGPESKTMFR